MNFKKFLVYSVIVLISVVIIWTFISQTGQDQFSFIVTADMRNFAGEQYQSSEYFYGACEAIKKTGKGAFMISPGDIDPPWDVYNTIRRVLGEDYLWYPVVGNHECETKEDMDWLREFNGGGNTLPYIINMGPETSKETMFSFDYGNSHFVIINEYYDGVADTGSWGDIDDDIYQWLTDDFAKTKQKYIFVSGHEPAFPQPDMDSGRMRHEYDSLNEFPKNRDRFWALLKENNVVAYLCGHTHNTSVVEMYGVFQLDIGHSRGIGDQGAASSFAKIIVDRNSISYQIYRDDANGGKYTLKKQGYFIGG